MSRAGSTLDDLYDQLTKPPEKGAGDLDALYDSLKAPAGPPSPPKWSGANFTDEAAATKSETDAGLSEAPKAPKAPFWEGVGARAFPAVSKVVENHARMWSDYERQRRLGGETLTGNEGSDAAVLASLKGAGLDPAMAPEMAQISGQASIPSKIVGGVEGITASMADPYSAPSLLIAGAAGSIGGAALRPAMGAIKRELGAGAAQAFEAVAHSSLGVGTFSASEATMHGESPGQVAGAFGEGAAAGALTFGLPLAFIGTLARVIGIHPAIRAAEIYAVQKSKMELQAAAATEAMTAQGSPPAAPTEAPKTPEQSGPSQSLLVEAESRPSGESPSSTGTPETGKTPTLPQTSPEPTPVPETPATIAAQTGLLESGKRRAILVTPGAEIPALPEGMAKLKTTAGVFIYDPGKLKPAEIRQAVRDNKIGDVLEYGISQKPAPSPDNFAVVVRDPAGTEVSAVLTDKANAESVVRAAERVAQPGDSIKAESAGEVIAGRLGAEADAEGAVTPTEAGGVESWSDRVIRERTAAIEDRARQAQELASGAGKGARPGHANLIPDLVDYAAIAAARLVKVGERSVKALRAVLDDILRTAPHLVPHRDRIESIARGILADSRSPDGTIDPARFESALAAAQAVGTKEGRRELKARIGGTKAVIRETTGQGSETPTVGAGAALQAGLKKSERAAMEAHRQTRKESLASARQELAQIELRARGKLKRAEAMADVEQRGAVQEAKAGAKAQADTAGGIRDEVVRLVREHVPKTEQGRFLGDAARAKSMRALANVANRAQHTIADVQLRAGVKQAARASKAMPRKLLEDLRRERNELRAELKTLRTDGAWRKLEALSAKAAAIDNLDRISDRFKEIAHQQREFQKVRMEGKVIEREAVISKAEPAIRASAKELPQRTDLKETRFANPRRKVSQALANQDTIGAWFKDETVHKIVADQMWDGETLVNRDVQAGHDALSEGLKAAGYRMGAEETLKLSRGASGDQATRMTINLPAAGKLSATPAEWMELWAYWDDAKAGANLKAGTPFNWARDRRGKPMYVTAADMAAIEKELGPKLIGLVSHLKNHVEQNIRPGVFQAFREQMGHDLEAVTRYWRTRRNREQTEAAGVVASMRQVFSKALENLGFLKERERDIRTPYLIGDLFSTYREMVHQGAVVSHMTRRVRNAEGIFGDKRIKGAIESSYGEQMNKRLEEIIEDGKLLFAEQPEAPDAIFNALTRNVTRAKLQLNPVSMSKNLGGIFKYYGAESAADIAKGLAWAASSENRAKMAASPFFRDRYEHALWARISPLNRRRMPILGEADKAYLAKQLLTRGDREAFGELVDRIKAYDEVDKYVVATAWGIMESKAARLNIPEAKRGAWIAKETEYLVRRTQNGVSAMERSGFQRDAGKGVGKLFTPFTSDSSKSLNQIIAAFSRSPEAGRRALLAVSLNNLWAASVKRAFQFGTGAGLVWLLGKQLPKKSSGETEAEKLAWDFLRNTAGTVQFGDLVADGVRHVVGKYTGATKGQRVPTFQNPMFQSFGQMVDGVYDMASTPAAQGYIKSGPDRGKSRSQTQFLNGLEKAALGASDLAGVPISPLYQQAKNVTRAVGN